MTGDFMSTRGEPRRASNRTATAAPHCWPPARSHPTAPHRFGSRRPHVAPRMAPARSRGFRFRVGDNGNFQHLRRRPGIGRPGAPADVLQGSRPAGRHGDRHVADVRARRDLLGDLMPDLGIRASILRKVSLPLAPDAVRAPARAALELLQIHNLLDWARAPATIARCRRREGCALGHHHYRADAHAELERVLGAEASTGAGELLAGRAGGRGAAAPFCQDKGTPSWSTVPVRRRRDVRAREGPAAAAWPGDRLRELGQFFLALDPRDPAVNAHSRDLEPQHMRTTRGLSYAAAGRGAASTDAPVLADRHRRTGRDARLRHAARAVRTGRHARPGSDGVRLHLSDGYPSQVSAAAASCATGPY